MRTLGKLAVAAGATAVILLAAPAANASGTGLQDVDSVTKTAALPVGGLQLPIVDKVLGGLMGGLLGGAKG